MAISWLFETPPPPARISTLLVDPPSTPCCVRTIWTAPSCNLIIWEMNDINVDIVFMDDC